MAPKVTLKVSKTQQVLSNLRGNRGPQPEAMAIEPPAQVRQRSSRRPPDGPTANTAPSAQAEGQIITNDPPSSGANAINAPGIAGVAFDLPDNIPPSQFGSMPSDWDELMAGRNHSAQLYPTVAQPPRPTELEAQAAPVIPIMMPAAQAAPAMIQAATAPRETEADIRVVCPTFVELERERLWTNEGKRIEQPFRPMPTIPSSGRTLEDACNALLDLFEWHDSLPGNFEAKFPFHQKIYARRTERVKVDISNKGGHPVLDIPGRQIVADHQRTTGNPPGGNSLKNKLHAPKYLDSAWVTQAKANTSLIEVSISIILDYLIDSGHWNASENFPASQFLTFFTDSPLLTHLHALTGRLVGPQSRAKLQDELVSSLIRFLTGESRSQKEISLETLLRGEIKQGSDPVARYSENFLAKVRVLDDVDTFAMQTVLCNIYLSGLLPALQRECVVNPQNKAWSNLSDLMSAANIEELRLLRGGALNPQTLTPQTSKHAKLASIQGFKPKHGHQQQQKRGTQGQQTDTRPAKKQKISVGWDDAFSVARHPLFTTRVYRECKTHNRCFWCREERHPPGMVCPSRPAGWQTGDRPFPHPVDANGVPLPDKK